MRFRTAWSLTISPQAPVWRFYHMMELEKLSNASVALLQNVRSQKDGKKDIIKIEGRRKRTEL